MKEELNFLFIAFAIRRVSHTLQTMVDVAGWGPILQNMILKVESLDKSFYCGMELETVSAAVTCWHFN